MRFPAAEQLDLDMPATGAIWIKGLYVSHALQGSGLGNSAMDALEDLVTKEPLCARTIMLDTVSKKDQLNKEFAANFYGYIPKVCLWTFPTFFFFLFFCSHTNEDYRHQMRHGTVDEVIA